MLVSNESPNLPTLTVTLPQTIKKGVIYTYVLMKALASEYEMMLIFGWMTFVIPVVLMFGVSFFVSWLVARKNRKINMVEALKVPK